MRQIRLVIEYDGTNYSGWQVQPNAVTVQQVLEEALAKMLGEPVRLHSSGRTDAGVHARGMVACFRTDRNLPLRAFWKGMNTLIPPDVAVRSADEVPEDFNPRRDASGKHYRYTIYRGDTRSPLARHWSWFRPGALDVARMREGAGHFVGEHDFCAFRAYNCAAKTTVRTIHSLEVTEEGHFLTIDVRGTGFLKNMVRIMVGTLVEVGQGKLSPHEVAAILDGGRRPDAGATAPANGLCLMEVFYPESAS